MTNQDLFQDLKQFITATVSQQVTYAVTNITENMATKDDLQRVERRLDTIEARMATKEDLDEVDDKLDAIQDAIAETFQGYEQRLRTLEHRLA